MSAEPSTTGPSGASRWLLRLALVVCGLLVWPHGARAQSLVDEGRRLYEEADFVGALDALGRAEAGSDLTLADLEVLFEQRVLVQVALANEAGVRADLRRLLAVAPEHVLPRGAPPEVVRLFAQLRTESAGSVRVVVTTDAAADGVTITVRGENDWAGIIRSVRTSARTLGSETWDVATDAPLLVPTSAGERVEYFAEAIGPGGAVLARAGSPEAPLGASSRGAPAASGGEESWPIVLAVVAGVLVAGAVVGVVVGVTQSPTVSTQLSPFGVRF